MKNYEKVEQKINRSKIGKCSTSQHFYTAENKWGNNRRHVFIWGYGKMAKVEQKMKSLLLKICSTFCKDPQKPEKSIIYQIFFQLFSKWRANND